MNRLSTWVATAGGAGLLRPAPGTWGSAAALAPGAVLLWIGGLPALLVGAAIAFAIGVWAANELEAASGAHDPGHVVIDEVAGQWVAMAPLALLIGAMTIGHVLFAFALFRAFDIVKPWPVRALDRGVGGGFGVMIDDIAAGIYAALVLSITLILMGHI